MSQSDKNEQASSLVVNQDEGRKLDRWTSGRGGEVRNSIQGMPMNHTRHVHNSYGF